jgi:hypothetical protein
MPAASHAKGMIVPVQTIADSNIMVSPSAREAQNSLVENEQ